MNNYPKRYPACVIGSKDTEGNIVYVLLTSAGSGKHSPSLPEGGMVYPGEWKLFNETRVHRHHPKIKDIGSDFHQAIQSYCRVMMKDVFSVVVEYILSLVKKIRST